MPSVGKQHELSEWDSILVELQSNIFTDLGTACC
jgi:hypothetical protein